jgi:hypothetical protein
MISPPKMAKVLEPRMVATDNLNESDGWIPLVNDEEWEKAPLSLKMQVNKL